MCTAKYESNTGNFWSWVQPISDTFAFSSSYSLFTLRKPRISLESEVCHCQGKCGNGPKMRTPLVYLNFLPVPKVVHKSKFTSSSFSVPLPMRWQIEQPTRYWCQKAMIRYISYTIARMLFVSLQLKVLDMSNLWWISRGETGTGRSCSRQQTLFTTDDLHDLWNIGKPVHDSTFRRRGTI